MQKLKRWLILQKEGIFMGAVVGALLYWDFRYNIVQRFMLMLGIPVFPEWMGWATVMALGAGIGAVIDSFYRRKL